MSRALRTIVLTAIAALCLHATVVAVKSLTHPARTVLAVFRVGELHDWTKGQPKFVLDEAYPLEKGGYGTDGQQYLFIAHDPLLRRRDVLPWIDAPRYRYGRILLPALAATTCGGSSPCIPRAILGWNLLFAAGIGALAAALVAARGGSPWFGLLLAASGGLVCTTDIAGIELSAQCCGLLGVFLLSRERRWAAACAFALAALGRETYVLVPAGFFLAEAIERRRHLFRGDTLRRLLPLALAPAPAFAWALFLRRALPPDPHGGGLQNLAPPLFGPGRLVAEWLHQPKIDGHVVLGVLVGSPLLLMIGRHLASLRRDRSGLALAAALFGCLALVSSELVWLRPGGFARGLDFLYPGIVLSALARGDRLTALLAVSTLTQVVSIVGDHLKSG
ncbi:MAG: hypothetical protein JNL79_13745 [Myxococcales bacterium]|nr:hypothetical protein [Myxococcales bacterium]